MTYKEIYKGQTGLMEKMVASAKLKKAKLELDSVKDDQQEFRLYCNFLCEEVIEFMDAKRAIHEHCEENNPGAWLAKKEDVQRLADATDELADVMAFTLELMVFEGLDHDFMEDHLYKFVKQYDIEALWTPEPLELSFRIAGWYHNQLNRFAIHATNKGRAIIDDELIKQGTYPRYACRHHNPIAIEHNEKIAYSIMNEIGKTTQFLKNKPWKSTGTTFNREEFRSALVSVWLCVCWLCYANDLTSMDIAHFYAKKTDVNHDRVDNGY